MHNKSSSSSILNINRLPQSFRDSKFTIKSLLNIPPNVKGVAAVPCQIPMFKQSDAEELSEASCHAKVSHSKELLKKFLYSDVSVI